MPPTIACPQCTQTLRVPAGSAGRQLQCPTCQTVFQAPPAAEQEVLTATLADEPHSASAQRSAGESARRAPARAARKPRQEKYCHECGALIRARAVVCPRCGVEQPDPSPAVVPLGELDSQRIAAGVCGILLGGLGIHKFILGFNGAGVTMLLLTIFGWVLVPFTCGVSMVAAVAMHVIGVAEGVIYLCKSDSQFRREYVIGQKDWF